MNILVTFFLTTAFLLQAALPKNNEGMFEYANVVTVENVAAPELFSRAKLFVNKAFKSGKEVIQLIDEDSKTVVGNAALPIRYKGLNALQENNLVFFKFTISCKDNRYRYVITNFKYSSGDDIRRVSLEDEKNLKKFATPNMRKQIFEQVDARIKELISGMERGMNENEEW